MLLFAQLIAHRGINRGRSWPEVKLFHTWIRHCWLSCLSHHFDLELLRIFEIEWTRVVFEFIVDDSELRLTTRGCQRLVWSSVPFILPKLWSRPVLYIRLLSVSTICGLQLRELRKGHMHGRYVSTARLKMQHFSLLRSLATFMFCRESISWSTWELSHMSLLKRNASALQIALSTYRLSIGARWCVPRVVLHSYESTTQS